MKHNKPYIKVMIMLICILWSAVCTRAEIYAGETAQSTAAENESRYDSYGGGYAATGQIRSVSYSTEVYDASNGLPTSDAMCILGASDGRMWIGGYAGVICYDGSSFERLDTSDGLTSARAFYEDSRGRVWVGTNDNGVVVIEGSDRTHLTYKDDLPSSSIRSFAEDLQGNIFIGTTAGVCYADTEMKISDITTSELAGERIIKLDTDPGGRIYGHSGSGMIFSIDDCKVTKTYDGETIGTGGISAIMADPENAGSIYLGTESGDIYYGGFGKKASAMKKYSGADSGIYWMSRECERVWIASSSEVSYLDEKGSARKLKSLPIDSGLEMITSDYQGNLWLASSTQGVMKIVTNNFVDVTGAAGMEPGVANAVCHYGGEIYVGTDDGVKIISKSGKPKENKLARITEGTRIRCIKRDDDNALWVATYTNDMGLLRLSEDGGIKSFTIENGMPSNEVRCIVFAKDGSILAGTNGGLAVIKNDKVIRQAGLDEGIKNTVFLTLAEADDGSILAGSDGDGIYMIGKSKIEKLSRDDGLTSDVVMRITKDEEHDVFWIVTSNSIEYLKDGRITQVTSFPYNNNYDITFDDSGSAWILSSYGVYTVNVDEMLDDNISDYSLYTIENGLPYAITSNLYCEKDSEGNLFIPGRNGVIQVNINNYYEENEQVMMDVRSIMCDDERIYQGEDGGFVIPASDGRIQIMPSVMDYTMLNPTIRMYLEGGPDEGITVARSRLSSLEYTNLAYGDYILHLQIVDKSSKEVLQDDTFPVTKTAKLSELVITRVLLVTLLALMVGFAVWRYMRSTVIARQYEEISLAKEEAERANSAKSRFLANMSHEIRTPINTIMGMNEMVMREDATGVPKSYFTSVTNYAMDIKNASESLLGLINDLLDISKIESGKMHLVEQEYDTADMLRSIVSMIRIRSTQKELTFDVVVDKNLPKHMYGDVSKIKQIVLNLLTNAVKYTDFGGVILNVSMENREDMSAAIRFSVKDTGMGVREEDLDKLFSAYERLDEEKNSNIQGTGLGLNISKKFAELMDGTLVCESIYGEGSEFILDVTQRIVDDTPMGVFIEHDEKASKGPYVPKFIAPDADILVVDDTPMNLTVIKGLLKATKVFVTTSASGEDALDKIRDSHFDVVLLDHMMPGMDGVETVERIRTFDKELPVYALTANATAGEEFYKSKGFNGYLSKPVDSEALERTIMKHLPESMMEKPENEDADAELSELPDDMMWLYDTEGISVDDGVKFSGGIENFIFSLKMFLDTIDENIKVIKDALDSDNIRLYTIKVHALKSSARIIGAAELSSLAESLEDAGDRKDRDFIIQNTPKLLADYEEYKEKLRALNQPEDDDSGDKEPIPEDELLDAYEALSDMIPQMDYDAVEMILEQLGAYRLPEEDAAKVRELKKLLTTFDWEKMEELLK